MVSSCKSEFLSFRFNCYIFTESNWFKEYQIEKIVYINLKLENMKRLNQITIDHYVI
jgi:hypothetical protein